MRTLRRSSGGFQAAAEKGAGARNWLAAGVLLAAMRTTDDALQCLLKAHEEAPDSDEVLDALITTCFNANRQHEASNSPASS